MPRPTAPRLLLIAMGGASLIAGLLGALALLGFPGPGPAGRFAAAHGLLMPLGFLGSLIALERAVALGVPLGFSAPLALGIAGIALVAGLPAVAVTSLLLGGALVYVAVYAALLRRDPSLHTQVQAAGGGFLLLAALVLHTGHAIADAVPSVVGFLVLTVAGERLELARLVVLTPLRRRLFLLAAAPLAAGVVLALGAVDAGTRLTGLGLVALTAWFGLFDVARRTVRLSGVTRYIGVCLLAGYVWLGVAGAAWIAGGGAPGAFLRDTMLHAIFLGFVMSMVFGHAPVILPAVLRVPLPWRPWFYGHLALLHAGLVVRVAGDLASSTAAWQAGGILTVCAVILFVVASAGSAIAELRAQRRILAARAKAATRPTGG